MSVTIKAKIPQDLGKVIAYSSTSTLTVEACRCEECNAKDATVLIQGETDSFGWEPIYACEDCRARMENSTREYYSAEDVEERTPSTKKVFLVSECTNHDGYGSWLRTFTSYRQAVGFYRRIGDAADRWGGLYPHQGVREVSTAEAERLLAAERRARAADLADDLAYTKEREDEEQEAQEAREYEEPDAAWPWQEEEIN